MSNNIDDKIIKMKNEQRLSFLREAHKILDRQIDRIEQEGNSGNHDLAGLKKKRLHLKDQIAILEAKETNI
jgi:uncharacterized protein YdcH (DUF465 family)